MHARERIVRDCFAEQACSHCGTRYPPESVVVLARRRTAWMVLASCDHCERRGIFVVTFPHTGGTGVRSLADESNRLESQATRPSHVSPSADAAALDMSDSFRETSTEHQIIAPVTLSDVDAMHDFLNHFNGDFQSLFAFRRLPSSDDDLPPS